MRKLSYRLKLGRKTYLESLGIGLISPILAISLTAVCMIEIILLIGYFLICCPLGILGLLRIEEKEEK